MKAIRRLTRLTALALVATVTACAGDAITGAEQPAPPERGLIGSLLGPTGLLSCSPLPVQTVSATIGPLGGVLNVGPHALRVPAGALESPVTITGTILPGNVRAVSFAPHGLAFDRSVFLTMSYSGCSTLGLLVPKRIAYTDDVLGILEYLLSIDNLVAKKVTGQLTHFSNYAVAW